MKRNIRTAQAGYALILMVLALMGVGGIVLAGFTQGVKVESEHERYLHNQRILREAKQALLQYAYDYPQLGPGQNDGPGRLPCPDTDNDGDENYVPICGGNIVGRFPWGDSALNFYDARDASGERLWYAVSPNFGRGPGSMINSGSIGGITLEDRSGAMLHDGTATIPAGGVAAVIIAPGAPIDRNGTLQVRGTDDEKKDEVNYLDLFGTRDNAVFVNGNPNGFVTGPILDVVTGDLLVNDQMIVITAAEVIAMAEKATLQAYRKAILDYLDVVGTCTVPAQTNRTDCVNNPGVWSSVYPWLFNYEDVDSVDKLSNYYPVDADWGNGINYHGNYGRIPAFFGPIFSREDSQEIDNEVTVTLSNDYAAMPGTVATSASGNLSFYSGVLTDSVRELELISGFLPTAFSDDATSPNARLLVTLPAEDSFTYHLYFWDDDEGPATGFWRICPDDGDGASQLTDCHRDSSQNPDPGGLNKSREEILHVMVDVTLGEEINAGEFEVAIDVDYANNATITRVPAANGTHALIRADDITFANMDLVPARAPTIDVTYEINHHYHEDADTGVADEESGTIADPGQLFAGATLSVEMRYFPEIPKWAFDNGWHNSIRMAYADDYKPDVDPPVDCNVTPDDDCLKTTDIADPERKNKISLLVIAGEHDWADNGDAGLQDDLADVFDPGNVGDDPVFLVHEGNDKILVIEEL